MAKDKPKNSLLAEFDLASIGAPEPNKLIKSKAESLKIYTELSMIYETYANDLKTDADYLTIGTIAIHMTLHNELMLDVIKNPVITENQSRSETTVDKPNPKHSMAIKSWDVCKVALDKLNMNPQKRMAMLNHAANINSNHGNGKRAKSMSDFLADADS